MPWLKSTSNSQVFQNKNWVTEPLSNVINSGGAYSLFQDYANSGNGQIFSVSAFMPLNFTGVNQAIKSLL